MEDADLAHGPVELIREILIAVRVSGKYPNMQQALDFAQHVLLLLKAFLLQWNTTDFPMRTCELPMQTLPKVWPNKIWRLEHPAHATLAAEVKSSLLFMEHHAQVFEDEPWRWLYDCLDAVDIALTN